MVKKMKVEEDDDKEETARWRMDVARRIKEARLAAGFVNRSEFARRIGVESNSAFRYETGEIIPSLAVAIRISEVTGVHMDWLTKGKEIEVTSHLEEWRRTTPEGRAASEEAIRFLESVPLHGYVPKPGFFELLLVAFKNNLTADEARLAARNTQSLKDRPDDPE